MKKLFLLSILLLGLPMVAFSQQNLPDSVILKTGDVYTGTIILFVPNECLKIKTANNDIYVFMFNDIRRISKAVAPEKKESIPAAQPVNTHTTSQARCYKSTDATSPATSGSNSYTSFQQPGFGYIIFGGGVGIANGENAGLFKAEFGLSKPVAPMVNLGCGIGVRRFFESGEGFTTIPLYADFKIRFIQDKQTFFSAGLGYSFFSYDSQLYGLGFLFNPSIVSVNKLRGGGEIIFSIGCEFQTIRESSSTIYSPNMCIGFAF